MADLNITLQDIVKEMEEFQKISQTLQRNCVRISKIEKSLSCGVGTKEIQNSMDKIIEKMSEESRSCLRIYEIICLIVNEYKRSEFKISRINSITGKINTTNMGKEDESGSIFDALKDMVVAADREKKTTDDIDWISWFMKYVPENVPDEVLLKILAGLSIVSIPKSVSIKNREKNQKIWQEEKNQYKKGYYIENQHAMNKMKYGLCTANDNACEVIAVYNATQYLTGGKAQQDFPDLLYYFEKNGVTAMGGFGTSPKAIRSYFNENGYDTKMLVGTQINANNIKNVSDEYKTYIMTAYNNKSNLNEQIHTVSITKEEGKYYIHNAMEKKEGENSLEEVIARYNKGNGEAISLIGIK